MPDLSKGESVDGFTKHTMTSTGDTTKDVSIERGNTLPKGISLKSGRQSIVVANRISLKLGSTVKKYTFNDDELVEVWFHEIAAHAGRISQGHAGTHGKNGRKPADVTARDIESMFPKTETVPKVRDAIKDFLK